MRLLDLFCGAGGAAMGYARAGFEVVGVDIEPQPHYPFEFHQADALTFDLAGFDAIHASPLCQDYSCSRFLVPGRKQEYPRLIAPVRERLIRAGVPWIIENVEGAARDLPGSIVLCGLVLGLGVKRHRLFESNMILFSPGRCPSPHGEYLTIFGHDIRPRRHNVGKGGPRGSLPKSAGLKAMGIDWDMTRDELAQAIPPAYTEWLGRQLMSICLMAARSAG